MSEDRMEGLSFAFYTEEPPPRRGPCPVTHGPHRWAWLVSGEQACGYCEAPR